MATTKNEPRPRRIWEVVLDGFDGSTDATDDKVLWVTAPAEWNEREVTTALLPEHKGSRALEPVDITDSEIHPDDIDLVLGE